MQRSTRIFLLAVAIGLSTIGQGEAENKPSIATGEFLSVLAKNVATVLSPTLVGELHDGRPNRTVANATIVVPIVARITEAPKKSETTSESTRAGSGLEADTVRSAQTQSEVRPGNNGGGFPFNFDDNNYRYNYPGIGSQGGGGGGGGGSVRADYPLGSPFVNPGYYNADFYRGNGGGGGYGGVIEGNSPRVEQVAGVSPVETIGQGQAGRLTDSLDPSGPTFDRFRSLERFPPSFRNQFSEDGTNFPNAAYRFGGGQSSLIDPFGSNHQGITGNFAPNFRNAPGANNFARNYFQPGDAFQQRQQQQQQQGFRSNNNFDFSSSQRFQNPYDSYPRSLQRGPNIPRFYPNPYAARLRDEDEARNIGEEYGPLGRKEARKIVEASSSELRPKSEILKNDNATNSTLAGVIAERTPEILSVQGRVRFGRLLLPTLDDYDDLRFRPDDFREYLFASNNNHKDSSNVDNGTKNSTANDV